MRFWREVLHDDVMRAHGRWVRRGRTGEGQLVLRNEHLGEVETYGETFDHASFDECDFGGAKITHSSFDHAELNRCNFARSTLYSSRFVHARLSDDHFEHADVRAIWFTHALLIRCSFDGADLDRSSFVHADVSETRFAGARLSETQIDHAKFERCDFRGASLNDTVYGTQFVDCDFRGANIDRLKLKDTRFVRCKLAGVVGKPTIEGPFELTDSDFSTDDGASDGPRSDDQLRQQWEARES